MKYEGSFKLLNAPVLLYPFGKKRNVYVSAEIFFTVYTANTEPLGYTKTVFTDLKYRIISSLAENKRKHIELSSTCHLFLEKLFRAIIEHYFESNVFYYEVENLICEEV